VDYYKKHSLRLYEQSVAFVQLIGKIVQPARLYRFSISSGISIFSSPSPHPVIFIVFRYLSSLHCAIRTYVRIRSQIIVTVSPGFFVARKATSTRGTTQKERGRPGQDGLPSLFNCHVYCRSDKRIQTRDTELRDKCEQMSCEFTRPKF